MSVHKNLKILVLGGSYMQSGFIENALKRGCHVTVLDRDESCLFANDERIEFYQIDISDTDMVDRFLVKNIFDAYTAPVSEVGNITLSRLSRKYGFKYNSEETVRLTTNKADLREKIYNEANQFYKLSALKGDFSALNYPVIVKPSQSSASRGVTMVDSERDMEDAIRYALKYCKPEEVIIEKYARGKQYSVETISYEGQHHIVAVVEEHMSPPPFFIERSDVVNMAEQPKLINFLNPYVQQLLSNLNVEYGPCHIEIKIEGTEIFLIEIASRSGLLRDRLIQLTNSINYNDLILNSYLGNNNLSIPELTSDLNYCILNIMLYNHDLEIYNEAKKSGYLADSYFYPEKKEVTSAVKLTDAFGYFFVRLTKSQEIDKFLLNNEAQ